ncbi:hypothetical protein KR093_006164 [Drosophila rubida]|uniref:C2H2-type domain-containing protein n=1 Tax=Drosophila rubida TaxID=30044 RepID=A0AAD4PKH6_9MUSC|nr:hypothetical protein KR093_006164 [Drosophila rubida]
MRHAGKHQLFCECGRYYNTESRLKSHQQDECQDLRRYQCDICLKWFKRRSHVNRHKKLHKNKQWPAKAIASATATATATARTKAKAAKSRTSSASSAFDPMDLNPTNIRVANEADVGLSSAKKYNLRGQDPASLASTSKQLLPKGGKESTENQEPPTTTVVQQLPHNHSSSNNNNGKKPLVNNADALIALQQLASISTARSLQHLVPHLPQNLHIDTSSLVPGRKLPRQSSKRTPPYESNRCPLCARVYRSQAFLNEHMRKEHSVLI